MINRHVDGVEYNFISHCTVITNVKPLYTLEDTWFTSLLKSAAYDRLSFSIFGKINRARYECAIILVRITKPLLRKIASIVNGFNVERHREDSDPYCDKTPRRMILWPWNHANRTITFPSRIKESIALLNPSSFREERSTSVKTRRRTYGRWTYGRTVT